MNIYGLPDWYKMKNRMSITTHLEMVVTTENTMKKRIVPIIELD